MEEAAADLDSLGAKGTSEASTRIRLLDDEDEEEAGTSPVPSSSVAAPLGPVTVAL